MYENKIIVSVKTPEKLNAKELYEVMADFKARMEGYQTETPEPLKGAQLSVGGFIEDGVEMNIVDVVKKMTEN